MLYNYIVTIEKGGIDMDYEKILLIIVAFASIIQFYLTFIKGKSAVKTPGHEIYRLRSNGMKLKFLGLILVFIMFYLIYSLINSTFSYLGAVIVTYALLFIVDLSKIKVITEKGIGQRPFFNNQYYNFTLWEDMVDYEWSTKRSTMLIFKFNKEGNVITKDWEVSKNDMVQVEDFFKKNVKIKIEESQNN